jgi:hypothetical protein
MSVLLVMPYVLASLYFPMESEDPTAQILSSARAAIPLNSYDPGGSYGLDVSGSGTEMRLHLVPLHKMTREITHV